MGELSYTFPAERLPEHSVSKESFHLAEEMSKSPQGEQFPVPQPF
jgi:hypothetical protein